MQSKNLLNNLEQKQLIRAPIQREVERKDPLKMAYKQEIRENLNYYLKQKSPGEKSEVEGTGFDSSAP